MALNPLHQFEIKPIATADVMGISLTFTNHALWMFIALTAVIGLFLWALKRPSVVPGRAQAFAELTYDFVHALVRDTAGVEALKYLPFIMSLFIFIAMLNLFGMIPGSFTATSQIYTTGLMAFAVFFMVVGIGLAHHGLHFFTLFFPKGTPLFLAPLIIPLEVISFLARPFTLAIRLAANMVAGHVLLKIFASFAIMLLPVFAAGAILPLFALIAISALEVFVALLQAYIFTVLTCVYLNDALHMH
jgi:F-type H+-transporting ATPase subunit a